MFIHYQGRNISIEKSSTAREVRAGMDIFKFFDELCLMLSE